MSAINMPYSPEVQAAIVAHYCDGFSLGECAAKYGVSRPTCKRYVDTAGKMRTIQNAIKLRDSKREGGLAWKGGRSYGNKPGYISIYQGRYENGNSLYKAEHILITEAALGRKLRTGEVVHHLNGEGTDNRNCNLLLCDRAYHAHLHQEMGRRYQQEHFCNI